MDFILHVASPFPVASPKNEEEVIKPAVEGTLSVLKAVKGTNTKRVVITSSVAAIMDHTGADKEVDETSWPPNADELTPYYKSKIQAEKKAWEYWKELKSDETFELVTVNPGVVTGPLLTKAAGGSVKIFEMIMKGDLWSIPQVYFPTVDVRDVARAHLQALTLAKSGERYAIVQKTYYMPDLGQMMSEEFSQYGYKVTTGTMCKFTAWMASFVDTDAKGFYNDWGVNCQVKNKKSQEELKMEYMEIKESLKDMGESFIELGIVENLKKEAEKDPSDHGDKEEKKKAKK